jgi:hypothetical protein
MQEPGVCTDGLSPLERIMDFLFGCDIWKGFVGHECVFKSILHRPMDFANDNNLVADENENEILHTPRFIKWY